MIKNLLALKLKPKSDFSKNILTLMTGTTIAQAIPVAISPILTRIYTPQDFGVFALFYALSSILGTAANGRYELAIMLPRKNEDAINIFALGFIINCILSLILLLIVIFFNADITDMLDVKSISAWLYFIPLAVFFTGIFNLLTYFNNRLKNYKDMAKASIIKAIVLSIIQLSIGFLKDGAMGLITGQIFSQMFANLKLFKNIIRDKDILLKIKKVRMIALAKKYKNFPRYTMFSGLLNTSAQHLTNILISSFYSVKTLGFYALIQRALGVPSSLIGAAVSQVFFRQAMEEKRATGSARLAFNTTVKKLMLIGFLFFGIIFFIIEDLFAFVFGESWRIAGSYAQIVIPFFYIRFFVAPVTMMNIIFGKNNIDFYWQLALFILHVGIISMAYIFNYSFRHYLFVMSIIISLHYLLILYVISTYNRAKKIQMN